MPTKVQVTSTVIFPLSGGIDSEIRTFGMSKSRDLGSREDKYRWDSSAKLQTSLAVRRLVEEAYPGSSIRVLSLIGTSSIQNRGPRGYHVNWVWEALIEPTA